MKACQDLEGGETGRHGDSLCSADNILESVAMVVQHWDYSMLGESHAHEAAMKIPVGH